MGWTAGAVTLERVAQDGMRVRASAGASSFRRQETLEKHLKEARAHVARLAKEREHPDPGRGSTAEWANAQVSQHGVSRFTVRGLAKVTSVMLLVAVGHNLLRWVALTT